jgi:hypothetical protein
MQNLHKKRSPFRKKSVHLGDEWADDIVYEILEEGSKT